MTKYQEPKRMDVPIKKLYFNLSNFRLLHPVDNEEQAILEMLRLKKVGPNKIKNIIADIAETNVILEDFIVLVENNKYIVYDGNRRLTAIKLLDKENIKIIENEFSSLYKFIQNLNHNIDIDKLIVSAKVYTDKGSVLNHIKKLHSGEQDGVGQISWGSIEKSNFDKQITDKNLSFSNLLLDKIKSLPQYQTIYNEIISTSISTTIDRIFGFVPIKERIFGVGRGQNISLDNENSLDKVCEMIDYFIDNNGTVTDVYYRNSAIDFFASIEPVSSKKIDNNDGEQLTLDQLDKSIANEDKPDELNIMNANDNPENNVHGNEVSNYTEKETTIIEDGTKKRLRNPSSFKYLTSAYQINKHYKLNPRINSIKNEISSLEYKEFKVSAMFLIRALLEAYTHTYLDFFSSLSKNNNMRLNGIPRRREKRKKSLQDLLYQDIKNHLKFVIDDYSDTYELIETSLSNNNNTALTQIINYFIHSTTNTPDSNEILEAWKKIVPIINTLDEVLYNNLETGQKGKKHIS